MKYLSLFSGIGGLDLGLDRAGMECVGQIEWDEWCQQILAKHWPTVPKWEDVHDFDYSDIGRLNGFPDLVCGGFPCQPVSYAGKRQAQADDRWLWPEFFRVVRMVRPRYVLVENVPGLASAGMGDVLGDLAAFGYDAEWQSIPAAAVGAPHLRWRIFIVAWPQQPGDVAFAGSGRGPDNELRAGWHESGIRSEAVADASGQSVLGDDPHPRAGGEIPATDGRRNDGLVRRGDGETDVAHPDGGQPHHQSTHRPALWGTGETWTRGAGGRSLDDWWATEPDVGRVADGVPRRVDRLRGLGNAVVPQVAEQVGRMILAADGSR